MKKLLIGILLLFSSMFGDCFESYKKLYYYQGIYSSTALLRLYIEHSVDISKVKDDDLFNSGNDFIIKIAREEGYTKALNYIQNMNKKKKNIEIAKKEFINGFTAMPKIAKKSMNQYGISSEQAIYNIRIMANDISDNSLRDLNMCVFN